MSSEARAAAIQAEWLMLDLLSESEWEIWVEVAMEVGHD